LNFDELGSLEYTINSQNQFVEMNDAVNSALLKEMPETLRSMFTELTFIGALYLDPKYAKKYEEFINPKYDFTADSTVFFYYALIGMGKRTDWKISPETVNAYMADNKDRAKVYQKYGGYKWVSYVIKMAESNNALENIENYYNMVKKYSLVREFWRKGLKGLMENIVKTSDFAEKKPRDILLEAYNVFGKVYTKLANGEEVKDLTSGCEDYIEAKLEKPEQGLDLPFPIMTQIFQGVRLGQFWAWGMLSNAGKSRFLIRIIAHLAFVQKKKILIITNEMTEEEMRICLITTTINNPDIIALHGIDVGKYGKNQVDIQNGVYEADAIHLTRDDIIDGKVIRCPNETIEEYKEKLEKLSTEYRNVKSIARWIDKEMKDKIRIVETGGDYSDKDLKQIIENTCVSEGIDYVFYDTFKSDKDAMGDWSAMKKTATILSEIAKKKNLFIGANIQLTDDANFCKPLELSSSNIANSKQIKHVLDALCLFKEIPYVDFDKYVYWEGTTDKPKQCQLKQLNPANRYYVCRIDKNRAGIKPDLLFELNLNTNIWTEVGRVGDRKSYDAKAKFVSAEETHNDIEKQEKKKKKKQKDSQEDNQENSQE